MKITLDIPEYNGNGVEYKWEDKFEISVNITNQQILISANTEGLISLATQLLTLAQKNIPAGHHVHYDEHNSLENGSTELVIQKI
jgi:hypothetical protein